VLTPLLCVATVVVDYDANLDGCGEQARFRDDVERVRAIFPSPMRREEKERAVRYSDAGAARLVPGTDRSVECPCV
jgi:hypothetical protein